MRLISTTSWMLLVAALAAACSSDPAGTGNDDVGNDTIADTEGDGTAPDVAVDATPDVAPDIGGSACPPAAGEYGAPCETADDCASGLCVPDGDAAVCSLLCESACASLCDGRAAFCRGVDLVDVGLAFVCQPDQLDLCGPCTGDDGCSGGRCLAFDDGTMACGLDCATVEDCPSGYVCGGDNPDHAGQCVPQSATCSCTEASAGLERPCSQSTSAGTCRGTESCDPARGWVGCDAARPSLEACNGLDDDCDGVIDEDIDNGAPCEVAGDGDLTCPGVSICQGAEGFACLGDEPSPDVCDGRDNDCDGVADQDFVDDAGRYTDFENCGACGNNCTNRFVFATEIACDTERDVPACVVVECEPGYQRASDTTCLPVQTNLCQPCTEDVDCNRSSPGARCVTIVDDTDPDSVAQVCGRDCSPDGLFGEGCPDGYVCDDDGLGAQCVPARGTCACIGSPDGFSLPCRITATGEVDLDGTIGELTCSGQRGCDDDGGFGACMLDADVCDGFDNDCSGRIDDAYRAEDGRYTTDAHCGRCNNDCTAVFTFEEHRAEGRCDSTGAPTCEMVCVDDERGTFVDVVNGTDDGCECELLSDIDTPADDPASCPRGVCDADCDGIDGDIELGLFVSRVGDDAAAGTREAPLASLRAALARAEACLAGTAGEAYCPPGGIRDIYVATGVYSENVTVVPGISLYGGYGLDFSERNPVDNPTTLFGVAPTGGERGTVTAVGVVVPTTISGFNVYGSGATAAGASSYAVYFADSSDALRLIDSRVVAGNGGDGRSGSPGSSGARGADGGDGQLGRSSGSRDCAVAPTEGGAGGASTCGADGGDGGDARCPVTQRDDGSSPCVPGVDDCRNSCDADELSCDPLPPTQGVGGNGAGNGGSCSGDLCGRAGDGTYDFWADDGLCFRCGNQTGLQHQGLDGQDGLRGRNADGGLGCVDIAGTVDASGRWVASTGDDGADNASRGGGGGGGSAGAGFDIVPGASGGTCTDNLGGSGGGGGGGGCPGGPATGGNGGGASFAIFIFFSDAWAGGPSLPLLQRNTVVRGRGGAGGDGGPGGVGGLGGDGGDGGYTYPNSSFCTRPGGGGGNGGTGGAGGGGGGGCGGSAWGVFVWSGAAALPGDTEAAIRAANAWPPAGDGGRGGSGGPAMVTDSIGGTGAAGDTFDVEVR